MPNCGTVLPSAEFPASSPHVTGVGGTNLVTTYTGLTSDLNSQYVRESAFADPLAEDIFYGTSATGSYWGSGGGNSILFKKPLFQALTNTGSAKFRTVPDLALHMGGCPGGAISCGADDSFDYSSSVTLRTASSAPAPPRRTSPASPRSPCSATAPASATPTTTPTCSPPRRTSASSRRSSATISRLQWPLLLRATPGYNRVLGLGTLDGKKLPALALRPRRRHPPTPSNP
jgi:kumamolisin